MVAFDDAVEVSGEEGTEREEWMWGRKIAGGSLGSRKNELARRGAEIPEVGRFQIPGSRRRPMPKMGNCDAQKISGRIVGFL